MNTTIFKKLLTVICCVIMISLQVNAQNKDVDKGNEALKKAMEQSDAAKRQEFINKAIESWTKGGLKREMYALIGDAFLEKKDYVNAASNYSRCDKELKKEGLKKVAEGYVEDAFAADAKQEPKLLKKAMDFYAKSEATKEGARAIGDKYYERGFDSYMKALDFYLIGDAAVKIEQIAKEYFDKGGENQAKAAEIYLKMKNADGYRKGGDIYYNRGDYGKAIEAYVLGAYEPGIQKYAELLYTEHRDSEADDLIMRLGDAYAEKKNEDAIEKLAAQTMSKGSYMLASKLYDKAGNVNLGDKCRAYDAIVRLSMDEAKSLFGNIGDKAAIDAIVKDEKYLWLIKDQGDVMDELMRNAPPVNLITDSASGKSYPSAEDQKIQEEYYKSIREQIIKNCYDVSANYAKLVGPEIKKLVRQRFLRYGAVRNILDKETLAIKKQKQDIKVKDVIL